MNTITKDNYEAYLLDFSEGNLTSELQMELELFLIQHPELEIDLDAIELLEIEKETVSFANKLGLKKTENDLVSEDQFIAYIENQLAPNERLFIEESCKTNASLLKDFELFKHSIVEADANIIFENKESLKRKPKVIWFNLNLTTYGIAAAVALLIGLFSLWPLVNPTKSNYQFALKIKSEAANKQTLFISKSVNQNTLSTPSSSNQQSTQIANSALSKPKNNFHTSIANTSTIGLVNDSTKNLAAISTTVQIKEPEYNIPKNSLALKNEKINSMVEVITESEDDLKPLVAESNKKGIWATASRVLRKLNHAGVKGVNSSENETKSGSSYAYNLGGLNLTHKSGL